MSSNDYIRIPAAGDPMQPSRVARLSWTVILTLAAIGGSLALSCVAPFAALAVALGGTAGLRASLRAVAIVWLANQVVGFVFFHFPITTNTFLWGIAIGIAALVTTTVAFVVMKYAAGSATALRLGICLLLSFGVYEMTLLVAAFFLGGLETFRPSIIAQLAWINAASLMGMIVLNEVAAALCRPWLGRMPRLARSS